ncbi:MAG: carbohydrate ABC transporter permease [Bifidobacteriaceae bacterium]|jgi:multiple sugar transport system permease protein|nr:carbohydrate ABC transporter permease [Bifidobacteriaceae bacterium]
MASTIADGASNLHPRRPVGKSRKKFGLGRTVSWILLGLFIFLTLFPFYWMIRTALSTTTALSAAGNVGSLLPADFTWGAIERVLGLATAEEARAQGGSGASMSFTLALRNSLIVASVTTLSQVTFSAMSAYAFARLRWPGRNAVFFALITAMMIPGVFTMLPNFILMRNLGLMNTFLGIMLPNLFMTPFSVFFMRQFFIGLPREVEEAAMIDGAGHWRRFIQVIVPMSSAPVVTLGLLTFINSWNDYMWPLLVARDASVQTLTVALGVFRGQTPQTGPDWAGLMAAALIAALPIVILYLLFGKRIINSVGFSGIK